MSDTDLLLTGIGIPTFSARGIQEQFAPVDLGELRRDINGNLRDLTNPALHRKYALALSGSDAYPLPYDGIWRGKAVTVHCTTLLGAPATFSAGAGSAHLGREAVSDSGLAQFGTRYTSTVTISHSSGGTADAAANFGDASIAGAGMIFYRPILYCLVRSWTLDGNEWDGKRAWTLDLEEV